MTWVHRHILVLATLAASACHGAEPEPPAAIAPPPATQAASEPARPMPPLPERARSVLAEIGPEADALRSALRMEGDHMALSRRDAHRALSPRVRAVMRRHAVRAEEMARYLAAGGAQ